MDTLPSFRYHPHPLETSAVKPSDDTCVVCGMARGYAYDGPIYGLEEVPGKLCPWCIADGSAAERFCATFTDDWALVKAGLASAVIAEVTTRTPGYNSWQAERWLSHCNDACEFHGDLPSSELERVGDAVREQLWPDKAAVSGGWDALLRNYSPGGDPSIYWFRCRHCGRDLFARDYS